MTELRCQNLAKSYGNRSVLSDIDLVVAPGTLTAILGPSGGGKTTLLRLIGGFIRPDRGTIAVGGTVLSEAGGSHSHPEKRAIGYVAQEGALFPHLTVGENVGFGLRRSQRRAATRTNELLQLVGLDHTYAGRRPHELSGGEQRRVALARALAPRPRLVLFDEPFSSLDAALRVETREAVLHALAEEGTTAVLVTHDQAEALSMGREVGVLLSGRLVQVAPPAVLYNTPADLEVARFVGDAVVLSGRASGGIVDCSLGQLSLVDQDLHGPVQVMIRLEQISLGPRRGEAGPSAKPRPVGRVSQRRYYGPETVVQVVLDERDPTVAAVRTFSHQAPEVGDMVALAVSGPVVAYRTAKPAFLSRVPPSGRAGANPDEKAVPRERAS